MASEVISKRLVDALEAGDQDKFVWDREISGFGLKVSPKGRKVYVLQYRLGGRGTPTRRYTIGRHGSPWTPDGARKEAKRILEQVMRGVDPTAAERERLRTESEYPFEAYLHFFLEQYGKTHWAPRTYVSAESNLRRYVLPHLKRIPLASIDRRHIVAIMDSLPQSSPALARSVYAQTRKLFAWAIDRGELKASPLQGLRSPLPSGSRDRTLSNDELARVWDATTRINNAYGAFVRLLILTGQRRDEVAGMEWDEIDFVAKEWTIRGGRTKNGETHVIPLTPSILFELDALPQPGEACSKQVFPSSGHSYISAFSSAKKQLDLEIARRRGKPTSFAWRFHDLRRTFATGMQRLGVRFEVTEALLNHVSGSRSGVAGVYQRHQWSDEKGEALQRWCAHVSGLVSRLDAFE